jgi:hypothetical protein
MSDIIRRLGGDTRRATRQPFHLLSPGKSVLRDRQPAPPVKVTVEGVPPLPGRRGIKDNET